MGKLEEKYSLTLIRIIRTKKKIRFLNHKLIRIQKDII